MEQMKKENDRFFLWSSNYRRYILSKSALKLKAVEPGNIKVSLLYRGSRRRFKLCDFSLEYIICLSGVGIHLRAAEWQKPSDEPVQPHQK